MVPPPKRRIRHRLAQEARLRFVKLLEPAIAELAAYIQGQLSDLTSGKMRSSPAELHVALNAIVAFQRERQNWIDTARHGWREALVDTQGPDSASFRMSNLGLLDHESVEAEIVASRLGTAITSAVGSDVNNLRLRVQHLEGGDELILGDVLRADTLPMALLTAWVERGLNRPMWNLVHDRVEAELAQRMAEAYRQANEFLVQNGVMAEINLKSLVRRAEETSPPPGAAAKPPAGRASAPAGFSPGSPGSAGFPSGGPGPVGFPMSSFRPPPSSRPDPQARGAPITGPAGAPTVSDSALTRAAQETRMLTGGTPLARVRQRAQGVLGQLRRLLTERVGDLVAGAPTGPGTGPASVAGGVPTTGRGGATTPIVMAPSPLLARALAESMTEFPVTELLDPRESDMPGGVATVQVEVMATRLRQRATELKAKAERPSEKAIIEIVALMFQAILAEERIPAAIRVWFARLQIPVLRLALAEPDFFTSIDHPARQLIDRMGASALGFDAARINDSRLETEIKRIVQVIEQYPETGRRVFQLVLDEFKKFLGRTLTADGTAQQAATLAQKVEQKEALSIQYTIELRRMLSSLPVQDDVREFLFRVWSEVLALSAVRHGAQQGDTVRYKQAAADLLWVASAKTDRSERSRVLQRLSGLLQVLREGMRTLGMATQEQDTHIKLLNEAVMQAFVSRSEGLPQGRLDELARGLASLEDVVTDDPAGDVLLDPGVIELMFGAEGDPALEVISSGGSQPSSGTLDWARELELGQWFALDHEGVVVQAQYAWRSDRGQLHLFSSANGKSYLVQTRRLAAYLQAGLLAPVEDEALTVRATREALAKLHAAPDQLLH